MSPRGQTLALREFSPYHSFKLRVRSEANKAGRRMGFEWGARVRGTQAEPTSVLSCVTGRAFEKRTDSTGRYDAPNETSQSWLLLGGGLRSDTRQR